MNDAAAMERKSVIHDGIKGCEKDSGHWVSSLSEYIMLEYWSVKDRK